MYVCIINVCAFFFLHCNLFFLFRPADMPVAAESNILLMEKGKEKSLLARFFFFFFSLFALLCSKAETHKSRRPAMIPTFLELSEFVTGFFFVLLQLFFCPPPPLPFFFSFLFYSARERTIKPQRFTFFFFCLLSLLQRLPLLLYLSYIECETRETTEFSNELFAGG